MKSRIREILNILIAPINKLYFRLFILLNKSDILNKNEVCEQLSGQRILILAPHVDDETIGCGGAILKYKNLGKEVNVCYLTKSQKRGSKASAEDIADERKKEAYKVAKEMDISNDNLFFLSGEDGNLIASDIEDELLRVIKLVKPDTIFLPVFLDTHVDHYATSKKILESYKRNPVLFKEIQIFSYESQSPITPIHSNIILNISDVYKEKLKLLTFFKSQNINLESIESINNINGLAPKKKACEVYINRSIEEYIEVFNNSKFKSEEKFLELRKNLIANRDNLSLIGSYNSSVKYKNNI